MKHSVILILALFWLSCTADRTDHKKFLEQFQQYCGYSYSGETKLATIGAADLFENAKLIMHLEYCDDNLVRIPFHIDNDTSRTWILEMRENGLHLSHDHRHPDGTEYEANMYGGYANKEGTETLQFFPADEQTIANRETRIINMWSVEIDMENKLYYYRLYLEDALRLEIEFDLSNPMPINR